MAAFARLSLPVPLLAPKTTLHRLQYAVAATRTPLFVAGRRLGSIRCGGDSTGAARAEAAPAPRSVPVRVAHELQQAGHRYLDVRTEDEFSAGHPVGAVNIPYMYKAGSGMRKNTHFLQQVSGIFGRDDEIIVGCKSGKRSHMAAAELCSAGFTAVTDIAGGFDAWTENGLPVNQ